MQRLRVEVEGRTLEVDDERVLRVGRAAGADVQLSGVGVSRAHAELRPDGAGWVLVDVGSAHGTFVDGDRVSELRLTRTATVRCGFGGDDATFIVTPLDETDEPDERAGFEHTVVLAAQRLDGGPDGDGGRSGPDLMVVAEGREHRFAHPAEVSIGRRPDCTVVLTDRTASRLHGRLAAAPGGWTYTNDSREGTYRDGRRVERVDLRDRVALRLGHPIAGPEVVVVPLLSAQEEERRINRSRWARRLRVGAAALVVALLVAGGAATAVLVVDEADRPGANGGTAVTAEVLTADELARAKVATVLITADSVDVDGDPVTWSGSGSIIGSDGLILTNAHVADPEAEGLAQQYGPIRDTNPDYLKVALIEDADDSPAAPAYRARVVVSDGLLDASVIRIYATIDGRELDGPLHLPTIPIGDSDELRTGDDVTVLGFPGISGSSGVSVTRGVISTFLDDPVLGERSEIDTDARIAPGNSGGAAIDNDAAIMGIPSATFGQEGSNVVSGRVRSINAVKPLIARARG
ncbi:FHA domain-containing protein [Nocardioides sp. cx-169]|uniref:FHA domain-containing protein n=1 Tax=Nocardioides sp. cx-169 TaxID=2899080 RepID=UPI001E2D3FCE|nr:FHA domain-containing protein [Nocardioides sp. cx-169]MCD4535822.1 FHA domain-containing protein [Nocardioides sp. cx-169]